MTTEDSALLEHGSTDQTIASNPTSAAVSPAADLPRTQFMAGVRTMTPFIISAIPMALLGGAFGINSGLDPLTTLGLAMIVNSGTVQFVGIKLIQEGANWAVILLTSLVLSLRLLIYSVVLRPHTGKLSQAWRFLLGFGLIDAVFFVIVERFKKDGDSFPGWQWFYVGASAAMYVTWMLATVVGIGIGASLPNLIQHGLDFPMTAIFAAMLATTLVNWKAWIVVISAGLVALLTSVLPYNLNLIIAIIAGAFAGNLCDLAEKRFATRKEA